MRLNCSKQYTSAGCGYIDTHDLFELFGNKWIRVRRIEHDVSMYAGWK